MCGYILKGQEDLLKGQEDLLLSENLFCVTFTKHVHESKFLPLTKNSRKQKSNYYYFLKGQFLSISRSPNFFYVCLLWYWKSWLVCWVRLDCLATHFSIIHFVDTESILQSLPFQILSHTFLFLQLLLHQQLKQCECWFWGLVTLQNLSHIN